MVLEGLECHPCNAALKPHKYIQGVCNHYVLFEYISAAPAMGEPSKASGKGKRMHFFLHLYLSERIVHLLVIRVIHGNKTLYQTLTQDSGSIRIAMHIQEYVLYVGFEPVIQTFRDDDGRNG